MLFVRHRGRKQLGHLGQQYIENNVCHARQCEREARTRIEYQLSRPLEHPNFELIFIPQRADHETMLNISDSGYIARYFHHVSILLISSLIFECRVKRHDLV